MAQMVSTSQWQSQEAMTATEVKVAPLVTTIVTTVTHATIVVEIVVQRAEAAETTHVAEHLRAAIALTRLSLGADVHKTNTGHHK